MSNRKEGSGWKELNMSKQSPQAAVQSTPKPKKKPNKMPDNEVTESKLDAKDKEEEESGNSESNVLQEPTSPRKDASTDPQIDMTDMIKKDDLKDILECPVCLRVPRGTPIYQVCGIWILLGTLRIFTLTFQCARGHIVCSECRPNVTTCPQCRDPLGNIRSLISEKMLEKLPCVCKYTDQGCQVRLQLTETSSKRKKNAIPSPLP